MKTKFENLVKLFNFIPLPLVTTDLEGNVVAGNKAFNSKIDLKKIDPKYIFGLDKQVFVKNGYIYDLRYNEELTEDKRYILIFFIPFGENFLTSVEMREILNSSSDGLVVCNADGTLLLINKPYEEMTGVTNEFIGQSVLELQDKGFLPKLVTPQVLKEKKKTSMYLNLNGKEVLFTGTPVFNKDGSLKRVVSTIRDLSELNNLVRQLAESEEQRKRYQEELKVMQFQMSGKDMIVNSKPMREVVHFALKIAPSDCPVLITGESGTGKELLASLVHRNSDREKQPFIAVNCGALPLTIVESELFGYVGGAFTGAKSSGKPGLFELAHGGTIFLDEIGDLEPAIQTKVLRVIQEGEFYRLGGKEPTRVDVRIIAATNKNLSEMVENGTFRQDLYYRLNVARLLVPPLRTRHEDIPALAYYFIEKFNSKYKCKKEFSPQALERFYHYQWPGNIREFQNILERCIIISDHDRIERDMVDRVLFGDTNKPETSDDISNSLFKDIVEDTKRTTILTEYKKLGSTRKVAKALGINQSTVVRQLKKCRELS